YPWPGNIRQLENCLQQAVLISAGQELRPEHLPAQVRDHRPAATPARPNAGPDDLIKKRDAAEKTIIQQALVNHGYSPSRAASPLGISRVTLYKKMRKYGLMELGSDRP